MTRAGLLELFVVFLGAFLTTFGSLAMGFGPVLDVNTAKAALMSLVLASLAAGGKAALSAFVKTQEPFKSQGVIEP